MTLLLWRLPSGDNVPLPLGHYPPAIYHFQKQLLICFDCKGHYPLVTTLSPSLRHLPQRSLTLIPIYEYPLPPERKSFASSTTLGFYPLPPKKRHLNHPHLVVLPHTYHPKSTTPRHPPAHHNALGRIIQKGDANRVTPSPATPFT